jgi:hypothetical protein
LHGNCRPQDSGAANDEDEDEAETGTPAPRAEAVSASRRAVNRKLLDYLRVFSKFVNPKSLYMADRVRNLYLELLGKNDKDVQVRTRAGPHASWIRRSTGP